MAKAKKKRNKPYRGADAKNRPDNVIRVAAVKRNKPQQWWLDNKRIAKPVFITVFVVLLIIVCVVELLRVVAL